MTPIRESAAILSGRLAGQTVLAVAVILLCLGTSMLAYGDAQAASSAVSVGSPTNRFTPNVSNISAGDTVTFNWAAGTHVVDFKDVSPDINIDSAHTTGTTNAFTTPGTYYYYCSIHASEALATEAHVQAGDAMVGKIVVTAAGSSGTPATGSTAGAPTGSTPAPGAPSTGSGPGAEQGSDGPLGFALLATAAAMFALATAAAIGSRRRA